MPNAERIVVDQHYMAETAGKIAAVADALQSCCSRLSGTRGSLQNGCGEDVRLRYAVRLRVAQRSEGGQTIGGVIQALCRSLTAESAAVERLAGNVRQVAAQFQNVEQELSAYASHLGTGEDEAAPQASADASSGEGKTKPAPSPWRNFLDGVPVAVIKGSVSKNGTIFGKPASGLAEGDLLGASLTTKKKFKWDTKKKDADLSVSATAEGHLARGKLSGSVGDLSGSVEGKIGVVSATGTLGVSLYKDGKLSPALEGKLKLEAAAAKGKVEAQYGNEQFNGHAKAEGSVGVASVEAGGGAGMITYTDEAGSQKTELGVQGKAGAEAYVATGELSGGVTIFGIKIDAKVRGYAGGAGASASGRFTTGGISGSIGAGLGLGGGVEISVDWSNFSLFS